MAKKSISIGRLLLQVALGIVLAVAGIWALQGHGDSAATWLSKQADILGIIFGVIELLAGIFLILELFIGDRMGSFGNIINWIVIIVFAVVLVIDAINASWNRNFLSSLYDLAKNLVLLGGMWYLKD